MNRFLAFALLFCLTVPAAAQPSGPPHYRVLARSAAKNAVDEWSAAADQGYRMLFEGPFAVMHLETSPPDTYRYAPIPDRNLRSTFLNALNQQGAFGYAWVEGTQMLEKLPDPHVYEYSVVDGLAAGKRRASLDGLLAQGYRAVGRFGSVPVYLRDTTLERDTANPVLNCRSLAYATPGKLLREINVLAAQGFRYRSVELVDAGSVTLMEPCDVSCGGPFEYRKFGVKDSAQLEVDLNGLASQGFRLVRRWLEPYLVERPANNTAARYLYKVVEAHDAPALEQSLNSADADNFVPVGFVAHVGWTASTYLIAEKPAPSAGH